MKVILGVHKVWEVVDKGTTDETANNIATALIFQGLPETQLLQVGNLKTAKEMWDALKTRHLGADRVRDARLQTLMAEFEGLKMKESESIDDFTNKLAGIAAKTVTLGTTIDEEKLVKKFLTGLPRRFIQIVASIEQLLDLSTIGFEDVVGRLKAYEERVIDDDTTSDKQAKLMFTKGNQKEEASSSRNRGSFRGRGRGGASSRGRGRGRGRDQNRDQDTQFRNKYTDNGKGRDRSTIQCFRCDKYGHYASTCPERKQKKQEANLTETDEVDPALYMIQSIRETVLLNEEKVTLKRYESKTNEDDVWYLDNGASNHMTGNRSYFTKLNEQISGSVKFGDGSYIEIKGKGSILFKDTLGEHQVMHDIYYLPKLRSNIISLGQATECGCEVRMKDDSLQLLDQKGKELCTVKRTKNRLYKVKLQTVKHVCFQAKIHNDTEIWHARLGHMSFETMGLMAKKDMVMGLPKGDHQKILCESCLVGKQSRLAFPDATSYRASKPLELVYGDLCGPITPSTIAGNKYIFVLIDDYSRVMWCYLLKTKDEAFEKFKNFKGMIEKDTGCEIKTLRTDRGGEFTSLEFNRFCEKEGIQRQLTAPYTPQQNGVVERRNRTLLEMTRSILKAKKVPNYMWGEAVRHAAYIINRISTRAVKDKTPYEALKKKKPNVAHLRIFGCLAYAKVDAHSMKKLDDRSRKLVYLGTEPGSKAYRLYDPTTRRIVVNRDVVFDETNGWHWEETKDADTNEPGMFSVNFNGLLDYGLNEGVQEEFVNNSNEESSGSSSGSNPQDSPLNSSPTSNGSPSSGPNNEEVTQSNLRRSTRNTTIPARLSDYVLDSSIHNEEELMLSIDEEPTKFLEAKLNPKWLKAMIAEIESIKKNDTWILVELPRGAKAIGLKWVFKIKRNADGTINKYKARLVAKGYVQQHGVDFDEVFAPVARLESVRFLMALAASRNWELHHLDVKSAFLHGELVETVFVSQPEGFVKTGEEQKVYKLKKALYGLRQAPRAWNTKLNEILTELKFQRCSKEPAIYRRHSGNHLLIIGVYVDDLIVTGSDKSMIYGFKRDMAKKFEMSDLGKLTYYLGIEVSQEDDGIEIKQEGYAIKILQEFGMKDCNPTHCPMEPCVKLSKEDEEPEVNATEYRRMVGCLRYLLHTRPDLAYSVGVVSRYMQTPKQSHQNAIKHILRYVKGTTNYGIKYDRSSSQEVYGYSDSSHNVDRDDGKSTTGHVFYLGLSPITWCSQKQQTVALSSCEAEYMAVTAAACQALWLRELMVEITGENIPKTLIKVDNMSALALVRNPVFHGRSKHIHTRVHFIRECVEKEQVEVEHVPGDLQKADILTKALARNKFKEMRSLLGIKELSNRIQKLRG